MVRRVEVESIIRGAIFAAVDSYSVARMSRELPVCADEQAELLLIGAAVQGLPMATLGKELFWGRAHGELWEVASESETTTERRWAEMREVLEGDAESIDLLYSTIASFAYSTETMRQEAAERVVELAARRRLIALMQRLHVELAHDTIDCSDAEDELQRHLLKGYE